MELVSHKAGTFLKSMEEQNKVSRTMCLFCSGFHNRDGGDDDDDDDGDDGVPIFSFFIIVFCCNHCFSLSL